MYHLLQQEGHEKNDEKGYEVPETNLVGTKIK